MFRMGGDEFLIILPKTPKTECDGFIKTMNEMSKTMRLKGNPISVSFGSCEVPNASMSFAYAMDVADKRMYIDKHMKHAERE